MADNKDTVALTLSDHIGALARGLQEALAHLNQSSESVHGPALVAHLERMIQTHASRIPASIHAAAAAGNGAGQAEKRAN